LKGNLHTQRGYSFRWLVWGVMCLAYIIVFFHRIATGVVADSLMSEFGVTGAALGNLGAVYFYVYMIMQIPSGVLADTLGARITVSIGTLAAGIGSIIFGMASGIEVSYVGRFLVGLGVSVVFVAILKVLSQWFKESEFATISGLTALIGNGGALLAGMPLALAVAIFSWRTVFLGIGTVSIIIALLCYLVVRNRPEDVGLPGIAELEGRGDGTVPERQRIMESIKTVVTNRQTWPGFIAFAGLSGSILSFTGMWGVPYIMAVYGLNKAAASSYVMAATAGVMVGSLVSGMTSDKVGKRKGPLLAFGVSNLVMWLALVLWNNGKPPVEVLYPLMFLLGFSATGYVITWALAKEVNPTHTAGIALGTFNMGGFLGPSILQPLMGYVLDINWTGQMAEGIRVYSQAAYAKALMLCAAAVFIAVVGVLFVRETNCLNVYNMIERR
jgi:sugar phosphate permease